MLSKNFNLDLKHSELCSNRGKILLKNEKEFLSIKLLIDFLDGIEGFDNPDIWVYLV